jgi:hypothetical protein
MNIPETLELYARNHAESKKFAICGNDKADAGIFPHSKRIEILSNKIKILKAKGQFSELSFCFITS